MFAEPEPPAENAPEGMVGNSYAFLPTVATVGKASTRGRSQDEPTLLRAVLEAAAGGTVVLDNVEELPPTPNSCS